jgi:hypothetical protein
MKDALVALRLDDIRSGDCTLSINMDGIKSTNAENLILSLPDEVEVMLSRRVGRASEGKLYSSYSTTVGELRKKKDGWWGWRW